MMALPGYMMGGFDEKPPLIEANNLRCGKPNRMRYMRDATFKCKTKNIKCKRKISKASRKANRKRGV